jgi:hypothetical protein
MKIYKRQEFLKLPAGIFFAKGVQWIIDGFCVKGESINDDDGTWIDFFYTNLVDISSKDTAQHFDWLQDMLEKGSSTPINFIESRDGMFDDNEIFLVFEELDLIYINTLINDFLDKG